MNTITIVNLKCEGCARTITKVLTKEGFTNVTVAVNSNKVTFDGDKELAKTILAKHGYPEVGSPKAASLLSKTQSFISCAKGKLHK